MSYTLAWEPDGSTVRRPRSSEATQTTAPAQERKQKHVICFFYFLSCKSSGWALQHLEAEPARRKMEKRMLGCKPRAHVTQKQATWLRARPAPHQRLFSSVAPPGMPRTRSVQDLPEFLGIGANNLRLRTGRCVFAWLGACHARRASDRPSIAP